ncbi:N-acetylmannosamine kinase [uncultured archaeon]|nr:N-acetylmannosamine kinase [uncultured archaeon]
MQVLAVDVGASKIEFATKEQLRAGRVGRIEIDKTLNHRQLAFIISGLIEEEGADGVGLALPGMISGGEVLVLPNLQKVDGKKLSILLQKLPAKVFVENDVKCMALAHLAARGGKNDDFILIAPGSGIGGAIVRGGKLMRGANNMAGEFGHMKMKDITGGYKDWEQLCAGVGLEKRWRMRKKTAKSAKEIFKLADRDKLARRLVCEGAQEFGAGLASIANALDPKEIIIAGSVGRAYMKDAKLKKIVKASYCAQATKPARNKKIALSEISYPALRGALLMSK